MLLQWCPVQTVFPPAGKSRYCNHVVALLLELADYSLRGLKKIPEEKTCTSVARQWGIPSNKDLPKSPVMLTTIKKQAEKQGISSTLYDPRIYVDNERFMQKVKKFKLQIMNIDKRIGFGDCILNETVEYVNTKYGDFPLGSPISFRLQPIEDNFDILSNINKSIDNSISKSSLSGSACNLPFEFLKIENVVVPTEWTFSKEEKEFLQQLQIDNCESLSIEKRTISQGECQDWLEQRKYRITSGNAHKVLIRQRNFETLT